MHPFRLIALTLGLSTLAYSTVLTAQLPDPCVQENQLLAKLQIQLQSAIDDINSPHCQGPFRTLYQTKINGSKAEIAAAESYIRLGCPSPMSAAPPPALPFDLTSATRDPNGLSFNPVWNWQLTHPSQLVDPAVCGGKPWESACTSQPTYIDNSWKCFANGLLGGHANWRPVAYSGTVYWNSHSAPGTDDDYNIDLYRSDYAGLTVGAERAKAINNSPVVHMEFDSDETIDHFHSSWWKEFHKTVDSGDSAARAVIDGHEAIAIGLLGLDYAHSGGTELHPVYGLALHVNDDPGDDTWAIFVRNRGDEGYCSSGTENLITTQISFFLPRQGGSNPQVKSSEFLFGPDSMSIADKAQVNGPVVDPTGHDGTLVTFNLPGPSSGARINGVLHLTWKISPLASTMNTHPIREEETVVRTPLLRPLTSLSPVLPSRKDLPPRRLTE